MGFIIGRPECEGFGAIRVVVNRLSNMRYFIPCYAIPAAMELANLFLWEVVHLQWLPVTMVLDRGLQFAMECWAQLCARSVVEPRIWTAFLPLTDAKTKQMKADTHFYLCVIVNHWQDDWIEWLPMAGLLLMVSQIRWRLFHFWQCSRSIHKW